MARQDPNNGGAPATASILAPFSHPIFLAIWAANLVSNFGGLIQSVGASWLMTSLAPAADMVALVQAASTLPLMLFSLAAGAIADNHDRRIVMMIAQAQMLVVSVALALFAWFGMLTPWLLLALTFLIGCGSALNGPAWQASVGEQVPRNHLPSAVALNSLGFNIARSVGPAIGGAIVAAAGAAVAFAVNALSYVGLIVVLARWQRPATERLLARETLGSAMGAGIRYAAMSPPIHAVLARGLAFGLAGSAIWALMPLIARDLVRGGPLTYGLLLGAFGFGAVAGALGSARLRARFRNEEIVRAAIVGFGIAAVIAGVSQNLLLSMAVLMVAGAGWVLALATLNVTVQLSSPRWVVARALAIYQTVAFGGLAIGSWLWGLVAADAGLPTALIASGAASLGAAMIGLWLRLDEAEQLNLDPSRAWAEPDVRVDLDPRSGPVVVTVQYRVAEEKAVGFMAAMADRRRIRRRDGARDWSLLQDIEDPEIWVERFGSPTWIEHMRQHHRVTFADARIEQRVRAFHIGSEPPKVHHMLERPPGALPAGMHGGPLEAVSEVTGVETMPG